ncbi:MAG TPA: GIY-YIG nuclease family protein [bacterium]|nr:GIY-YIG nuclease family protein [bacterium]
MNSGDAGASRRLVPIRVDAGRRSRRSKVPGPRGHTKRSRAEPAASHFVYLLRCGDRTYYVGYTTDPARRLAAHRAGYGARYTRGRGPLRLVALWRCPTIAAAYRLELRLKRLPRKIKHRLAAGDTMPAFLAAAYPRVVAARVRRT